MIDRSTDRALDREITALDCELEQLVAAAARRTIQLLGLVGCADAAGVAVRAILLVVVAAMRAGRRA